MTEKRPYYFDSGAPLPPLSPPSMLLMRAGRIAGFDGRDGWPDAFTPKELAALQYPDDTNRQGDLIALLTPMIYRGEVEAVTVMRPSPSWIMGVPETYKDLPEPGITRRAAAGFLKIALTDTREEPSELVRAWLGNMAPTASQTGQEAPGVGTVAEKKEKIRAILTRLKELDHEFSRESMPGRKVDFFELCKIIEHDAFAYITLATFMDYLPGLCKFKRGARETDYYREIAPRMGVKTIKAA